MSLINQEIMKEFSIWAKENEDRHIFPEISKDERSYFKDRKSEETYMMEYSFRTMADLKALVEKHSGISSDPQLLRKLIIEICENRYKGRLVIQEEDNKRNQETDSGEKKLPEYVYVF